MKELIQGAYDLHVHSAPDVLPRKMDDLEMAQRIIASGMAGYAMKSHYFCTAERATLSKKLYPECDSIGTITLNGSVGGINPMAVEMAARAGAKLLWFPTCDGAYEQAHTFTGDPNKKLPFWANIVLAMKEEGISAPPISIVDAQGQLTEETHKVLDVIAKYNMILTTGHISHEETFALVKAAAEEHNVKNIIITHVDFPTTYYEIEDQKKLADYGALMEHCYTTYATKKVDYAVTLEMIRAMGPDHVILSTDLGQPTGIYPDEGLESFATSLYNDGFTTEQVRQMTVYNARKLLGKD